MARSEAGGGGSTRRTVLIAGAANVIVAVAKLAAGLLTGSSAMLAAGGPLRGRHPQPGVPAHVAAPGEPPGRRAGTRSATARNATSGRCWPRSAFHVGRGLLGLRGAAHPTPRWAATRSRSPTSCWARRSSRRASRSCGPTTRSAAKPAAATHKLIEHVRSPRHRGEDGPVRGQHRRGRPGAGRREGCCCSSLPGRPSGTAGPRSRSGRAPGRGGRAARPGQQRAADRSSPPIRASCRSSETRSPARPASTPLLDLLTMHLGPDHLDRRRPGGARRRDQRRPGGGPRRRDRPAARREASGGPARVHRSHADRARPGPSVADADVAGAVRQLT